MDFEDEVEIRVGMPEQHRGRATMLYYEAFRGKFESMLGSPAHAVAILERSFVPELGIVAVVQCQLVGVLGLQYEGRTFVDFRASPFVREFGWVRGLFRFARVFPLAHREQRGELMIDSVAVDPQMRGRGVGTRLLEAAFDLARTRGFRCVSLEVVDTNPKARKLYERMGFEPTKTQRCPSWWRAMGFSSATTMTKHVD